MAALDDVDGIDLNVTKVRDCRRRGAGAVPERSFHIESLGMQPDTSSLGFRKDYGNAGHWLLKDIFRHLCKMRSIADSFESGTFTFPNAFGFRFGCRARVAACPARSCPPRESPKNLQKK